MHQAETSCRGLVCSCRPCTQLETDLTRLVPPVRRVPPPPRAVAVRPIFLDTALNYIQPPDLSHRLPKKQAAEAQGTFSRLFGGWGAR